MPYITVRSVAPGTPNNNNPDDPSVAGHAWVEISGSNVSPNGAPESFGYYPEGNPLGSPGEIRDTDAGDYAGLGDTSDSYYITEEQAQAVRDYMEQVDTGNYMGLPIFGVYENCATVAFEAMKRAGVTATLPGDNWLPWLLPERFSSHDFDIDQVVNDDFTAARGWYPRDPLAIDLDGDGIETVGIAGGVLFDHDGDGIRTGTGWVKSDDALVVLDRDGNGTIDTGNELFGVDYVKTNGQKATNGFDALADLDGNADGLFNSSDAQYASVRLWRDLNQDGISQANELQSLSQAGITSINLVAHSATKNLGNGNTQILSADVAGIGTEAVALNLADNPFYREFTDPLDTTAVANLPDMQGSGRLRDLREAATLSTTLANQLADLQANYRTHDQFEAELETRRWRDGSCANENWRMVA